MYYKDIIEKIKKLIDDKNYNQATLILNDELSAPYIPSQYEQEFLVLLKILAIKNQNIFDSTFSFDKLFYLLNAKEVNHFLKNDLLDLLNESNLLRHLQEIKKLFLEEEDNFSIFLKAKLFEIIISQKHKLELIFNYQNIQFKIKTDCFKDLISEKKFIFQNKKITILLEKDPNLKLFALQLNFNYLLILRLFNYVDYYEEQYYDLIIEIFNLYNNQEEITKYKNLKTNSKKINFEFLNEAFKYNLNM